MDDLKFWGTLGIAVATILIQAGAYLMQIKAHEKRIEALEQEMREEHRAWTRDQEELSEIRGHLRSVKDSIEHVGGLLDKLLLK